ncbi:MAG: hypothetical protein ABW123_20245 [Cystobacter sp.]
MVARIKSQVLTTSDVTALKTEALEHARRTAGVFHQNSIGDIEATLHAWIASKPFEVGRTLKLGSLRPTFGVKNREPKAYWKHFSTREALLEHLVFESDKRMLRNRQHERGFANTLLTHAPTAAALNELRRAVGNYLWKNDSWAGWISHGLSTCTPMNLLPNWTGSYNEANSYPAYERSEQWETEDWVFDGIVNWVVQPILDYSLRRKDRVSLMRDERDFNVVENVAILHDVKELFSPRGNSRFFTTRHKELIPHPYQGAQSPKHVRRWNEHGVERVNILLKDKSVNTRYPDKTSRVSAKDEIKWDQGRRGAGTRDEESPDTKTARKTNMPIETGRSHTAARLFEMVSLLKPAETAPSSEKALFARRLKAMAYGIFAYWNADEDKGGYPKSLTPVHTYHEVMDPAEDYLPDIYSNPFTYEDLKDYLKA